MKLFSVLLIIVVSLTANIFPQVPFNTHPVTTTSNGPAGIYAIDVDSDGDMDVLSAATNDN